MDSNRELDLYLTKDFGAVPGRPATKGYREAARSIADYETLLFHPYPSLTIVNAETKEEITTQLNVAELVNREKPRRLLVYEENRLQNFASLRLSLLRLRMAEAVGIRPMDAAGIGRGGFYSLLARHLDDPRQPLDNFSTPTGTIRAFQDAVNEAMSTVSDFSVIQPGGETVFGQKIFVTSILGLAEAEAALEAEATRQGMSAEVSKISDPEADPRERRVWLIDALGKRTPIAEGQTRRLALNNALRVMERLPF